VSRTKTAKYTFSHKLADYQVLTKFRLATLVVFTAAIGFLLAGGTGNWVDIVILIVGGYLVTGASNALNQVFEKETDRLMHRTLDRPLAANRMTSSEAVMASGLMAVIGLLLLGLLSQMAALFGAISLFSYAFLYTPLKRITPFSVTIGAFPGAFPPLIGWVAATGTLGWEALALFAIQFIWQFPHFWAIGWKGYDDYARGGFYMLPRAGKKDKFTAMHCLVYTILLIPAGFLPYFMGVTGPASVVVATILALGFVYYAIKLYQDISDDAAKKVMFYSFAYLPLVLLAFIIDKI